MFGLAAQRMPNGKIAVVSPKDGIEFEINEDILNIHMIQLGDFCKIEVDNNKPVSFKLDKKGIENVAVLVDEKEKDLASVKGVIGTVSKTLALFYETAEFGNVACKDEKPPEIGSKHKITVKRLCDNQRTGLYSRYVWQGVSENPVISEKLNEKLQKLGIAKNNAKKETNDDSTSSEEQQAAPLTKHITGFVTGKKGIDHFVTCNLLYPGNDGIIRAYGKQRLFVGDWVQIRFSDADFQRYFPAKPTEKTPKFVVKTFKKIEKPGNYSVKLLGKSLEIQIKNLKVPAQHKKGKSIDDVYLGVISDGNKLLSAGEVDVVIKRRKIFETSDGKKTTWFLRKVKSSSSTDTSDSDDEEASTMESSDNQPKTSVPDASKKKKKDLKSKTDEEVQKKPPLPTPFRPMGAPLAPIGMPIPPQFFYPQPFIPPFLMPQNQFNRPGPPPGLEPKIHGRGFQQSKPKEKDLVLKRAVITSLKPNKRSGQSNKDMIAFLWLLDDHLQSVFYISKYDDLAPGHFFEGNFEQIHDKWECKKYVKGLGKLMEGSMSSDSIELQIFVHTYLPPSSERANPETGHVFIGKIIDKYHKLPTDCSGGVKIGIKLGNLAERNEWCWLVTKVFQSKHIQLLTEFHKAWHKPGIRHFINIKCVRQFEVLKELMDTLSEGSMKLALNQLNPESSGPVRRHEVEGEKENSDDKFGWTILVDGDFVRMIVFPRDNDQKMSEMKKNVTDKNVFETVEQLAVNHLYRVKLNEKGEVIEMTDCRQFFAANKEGEIEFKFVCSKQTLLARNVAVVEPIGTPKWMGNLMFCCPDRPISRNTVLLKARFRVLDDKDAFANDELVCDDQVCFISIGDAEKLPNQELDTIVKEETSGSKVEQNLFRAKLLAMPKEQIYNQFVEVCKILKNGSVIDELKKVQVDTDDLLELQKSAR